MIYRQQFYYVLTDSNVIYPMNENVIKTLHLFFGNMMNTRYHLERNHENDASVLFTLKGIVICFELI